MKLSGLVDALKKIDEEILITKNGKPAAVLVSSEEFDSWRETLSIQSDADLMEEIKQGLKELKKGRARIYSLQDLFKE